MLRKWVKAATRSDGVTYALVPIFVLAYPLLDTGFAIARRWLRGAPLSRADDRHIHHKLRAVGLGAGRTVEILCLGSCGVAVLGLCTVFLAPAVTVAMALAGALVLAVLLMTVPRFLQYYEFLEVGQSFASAVRNSRRLIRDAIHARDVAEIIGTARTLDEVSALLADAAVDLHFAHISVRPADVVMLDELARTYAPGLWRLEYPVHAPGRATSGSGISHDPMLLTMWCRTDGTDCSAGAERIARILAPAIGAWLAKQPASAMDPDADVYEPMSQTPATPAVARAAGVKAYLPV